MTDRKKMLLLLVLSLFLVYGCAASKLSYSTETDPDVLKNLYHETDQKIKVLSEEVRSLREEMSIARGPDAAEIVSTLRGEILQKEAEIEKLKVDLEKIGQRLEELGESVEE